MNIHVCENNVIILHQNASFPFCGVELWLHFGSADDPIGMFGIAHLIEHLICIAIKEIDYFFYVNMNATTSKDRIKISGMVNARYINTFIERFIECIINLNINDFNFEFQKQKVVTEILYTKKAPILDFLEMFDKAVAVSDGYDKPTFGLVEDINKLNLDSVKYYLSQCLNKGIILSITGMCEIDKICKCINKSLVKQKLIPNTRYLAISPNIYLKEKGNKGILYFYDMGGVNDNFTIYLLLEHLFFSLNHLPIVSKSISYQYYKIFCIYIPDNSYYYNEFIKNINIGKYSFYFNNVKRYLYDYFTDIYVCPNKLAGFNIESYYTNYMCSIENFIDKISLISLADYSNAINEIFLKKPSILFSLDNQELNLDNIKQRIPLCQ
jgi:predicted Zn-dependent peptidase